MADSKKKGSKGKGSQDSDNSAWQRHPDANPKVESEENAPVGGHILGEGDIEINAGLPVVTLKVRNTGDRPIQVGSHYHFFEANRYLEFDRPKTFGMRLDIPATTGLRFEPGDEKEVDLVPMRGRQYCFGFNNLVDGWTGDGPNPDFQPNREEAMKLIAEQGYKSTDNN